MRLILGRSLTDGQMGSRQPIPNVFHVILNLLRTFMKHLRPDFCLDYSLPALEFQSDGPI
jgi:hypothetical protein